MTSKPLSDAEREQRRKVFDRFVCPKCGQRVEVWSWKNDYSEMGGICRRCLSNVDLKVTPMQHDEIEELAREGV